jgi:hypothetical protein
MDKLVHPLSPSLIAMPESSSHKPRHLNRSLDWDFYQIIGFQNRNSISKIVGCTVLRWWSNSINLGGGEGRPTSADTYKIINRNLHERRHQHAESTTDLHAVLCSKTEMRSERALCPLPISRRGTPLHSRLAYTGSFACPSGTLTASAR